MTENSGMIHCRKHQQKKQSIAAAPKGKLEDRISAPVTAHERFVPELLHTPKMKWSLI
jgi:hypothetical protein